MLFYGSLTDPLHCILIGVYSLCKMCRQHTMRWCEGLLWRAVPFLLLMKIICLITALFVNNLNYTCTHKGRHLFHDVFWFDLGLSACLNGGGTLPLGSASLVLEYHILLQPITFLLLMFMLDKTVVTSSAFHKTNTAFIFQTDRINFHPLTWTGTFTERWVAGHREVSTG